MPQPSVTLAKTKATLWTSLAAGYSRRSGDASEDCTEHDLHGIHGMRGHHGGRWQARFSAALHCMASPWRRELRTIGRCPSQWFGFAPRRADACDPQQHKPSRARGCVREYSECFSPQQSTRGCRYLLPPVTASGRCSAGGAATAGASEHGHFTAAAISRNETHDGSASKCLTTNGIIQSWQRSHLPCRRSATRS